MLTLFSSAFPLFPFLFRDDNYVPWTFITIVELGSINRHTMWIIASTLFSFISQHVKLKVFRARACARAKVSRKHTLAAHSFIVAPTCCVKFFPTEPV